MEERNGTDVDWDRLKQLFEQLHFHVKVFNDADDLRAEEMLVKIKKTAAETVDGAKPQCFMLFIPSHGNRADNEQCMFGTDRHHLTKMRMINGVGCLLKSEASSSNCVPSVSPRRCCGYNWSVWSATETNVWSSVGLLPMLIRFFEHSE